MKKNSKWFTLIELLIVIIIIWIITLMTYIPYSHYQNKAKLKIATREISQSFYEAKNMARSWLKNTSSNVSVWLYITKKSPQSNVLTFLSYPHTIDEINISNQASWDIETIKEKELQDWVSIIDLWDYENLLFYYNSISWESEIYTFTWWNKEVVTDDILDIKLSYKNAQSKSLTSDVRFITGTNIIDYK